MYCSQCGSKVNDHAIVCLKCGCAINGTYEISNRQKGNFNGEWLTTLLLCLFLGFIAVHRFYTKNNDIAVLQLILGLCTCFIGSFIWAVIDLMELLVGSYRTGDGRILKNR